MAGKLITPYCDQLADTGWLIMIQYAGWEKQTLMYFAVYCIYPHLSRRIMLSLRKIVTKNQIDINGLQSPYSNTPPRGGALLGKKMHPALYYRPGMCGKRPIISLTNT